MNYKDYPVGLLKDIEATFKEIREGVDAHSNLMRITYDDSFKLAIEDLDFTSKFSFTIEDPLLTKENKISYTLSFNPTNRLKMTATKLQATSANNFVRNHFKNWISLLKTYQTLNIHPSNKVLGEYQKKFYNAFTFLDDDGDDEPLSPKYQQQISELVTLMIEECEKDDAIGEEIIEELKELNKSIAQLTQGQIKNSISWVFAKIMHKGIGTINRIAKNATNAGIGHSFIEGIKLYLSS